MATAFHHLPVMAEQVLSALNPMPGQTILDGTLGGGGHASMIAERLKPDGRLIGIDRDPAALAAAGARLAQTGASHLCIHGNYIHAKALLAEYGIEKIDGALLDLGVSSPQIDQPDRGFSYHRPGPLDMRMDPTQELTAADLVNTLSHGQLAHMFKFNGEERHAGRVAAAICQARQNAPILTTDALAGIVMKAMPSSAKKEAQHPARRTFAALRIAVNNELEPLEQALRDIISLLVPGSVCCILSFHSLEDRIVKQTFAKLANPCTCPRGVPMCICGQKPSIAKPARSQIPAKDAIAKNPREHSARLRTAVKI